MVILSSRKPLFWVLLSTLALISCSVIYNYFSSAFPIVNVDISMNRQQALDKAQLLATQHHWGPNNCHNAASFDRDVAVQYYVELEAGGYDAFKNMLTHSLYSPFTWHVRHFEEGEANETEIHFKPNGEFYGFNEKIAESEPGAHLHSAEARQKAEHEAVHTWNIKLDEYSIIETSQEERQNGRIDHSFVYERPTITIGEGRYRLLLKITGDKLTQLQHFIKIPEGFYLRYDQMRSSNKNIHNIGSLLLQLYQLLGALGLFLLFRRGWVIFRQPLMLAAVLSILSIAQTFNELPLAWMYYDTALSSHNFLLQFFLDKILEICKWFLVYLLTFLAAESLTRKAFGYQIQLCKSWTLRALSSYQMLGQIVGGYLYAIVDFALVIAIYIVGRKCGMWAPADTLINPNVLAHYMPWLFSFSQSFHAGIWEECLCRAIPLASMAIIGARYNKKNLFIVIGIILQAIIFGAAHANYAQQPAYARILETFFPSVTWALIYLIWGLIPVIIIHFLYDFSLYSLPILLSSFASSWISQSMVAILTVVPLAALIYARLRVGSWRELPDSLYNHSWKPTSKNNLLRDASFIISKHSIPLSTVRPYFIMGIGMLSLLAALYTQPWRHDEISLNDGPRISRAHALHEAQQVLIQQGVTLTDEWQQFAIVSAHVDTENRFIWQTESYSTYQHLLGDYLKSPQWVVRYASFDGQLEDRAEEYYIMLGYTGHHNILKRFFHRVPEHKQGENLIESQARALIPRLMKQQFKPYSQFNGGFAYHKEISATPTKLPHRTDWTFTYVALDEKGQVPEDGQWRVSITISGNEITDINYHIHVPEQWERKDRDTQSLIQTFAGSAGVIRYLLLILMILFIFFTRQFSLPTLSSMFLLFFCLTAAQLILSWPTLIFNLKTSQPIAGQLFRILTATSLSLLSSGATLGLLANFIFKHTKRLSISLTTVGSAVGLGLIYKAINIIATYMGSGLAPHWANYDAAGYYLPSLATALFCIIIFATASLYTTALVMMLNHFGKHLHWSFILLLSLIFGITSSSVMLALDLWLMAGICLGLLFFVAYRYLLGREPRLCFIMYATIISVTSLIELSYHAYPGAILGNILGMCGIWILCYYMVESH